MSAEPTIAELIGWTRNGELLEGNEHDGCCTMAWTDPQGETWDIDCLGPELTVDDMLAWLQDTRNERHGWQVHYIGPKSGLSHSGWEVGAYPWADGEPYEVFDGPTLHAALEAAVRAVAGGLVTENGDTQ